MSSAWRWYRSRSIGTRVFLGMAVGVVVGIGLGPAADHLKPIGDIFIRPLLMAAIPLIFFTLMSGLTTIKDAGFVGRLTVRILIYYVLTSIVAFAIAIVVMDLIQPGAGVRLKGAATATVGQMPSFETITVGIFPNNIVEASVKGDVTQIVVFGVFLGIATLMLEHGTGARVAAVFETGRMLFMRLDGVIIAFAPIGLGALTAYSVGVYGSKVAGPLLKFMGRSICRKP